MIEREFVDTVRRLHHRKDVDVAATLINAIVTGYTDSRTQAFMSAKLAMCRKALDHPDDLVHFYRAFVPYEIKSLDPDAFEALMQLSAVPYQPA